MSVSLPCPRHLQHLQQQQQHDDGGCSSTNTSSSSSPVPPSPSSSSPVPHADDDDVPVHSGIDDLDDDLLADEDQDVLDPVASSSRQQQQQQQHSQQGAHYADVAPAQCGSTTASPRSSLHNASPPLALTPITLPVLGPASASASSSTSPPSAPQLKLKNKPPHWNDGLRCWCLNFRGRVKLASVKNFQLIAAPGSPGVVPPGRGKSGQSDVPVANAPNVRGVHGGNAHHSQLSSGGGLHHVGGIAMQFGKVDSNLFILDYDPCLVSAAQAFAVALTTFESKILL
eukprot:jgi/Chrzof1/4669/Cz14g22060.t1